jgi:pyruvate,water dikinase
MVPFVRTIGEAECVKEKLVKYGFDVDIIMMCEIPSNVILIDEFSKLFDGFSIGSNDLTQLTLAVDRESSILTSMFDERDPAVLKMCQMAIEGARRNNKPIGMCGQAPSDFPELAELFIKEGITSLSLNPDCVLSFFQRYQADENKKSC